MRDFIEDNIKKGGNTMKYEDLPDVLTVQEVQKYLRLGRDRAYGLGNEIPHIKNGNRKLFLKEEVLKWAQSQGQSKQSKLQERLKTI